MKPDPARAAAAVAGLAAGGAGGGGRAGATRKNPFSRGQNGGGPGATTGAPVARRCLVIAIDRHVAGVRATYSQEISCGNRDARQIDKFTLSSLSFRRPIGAWTIFFRSLPSGRSIRPWVC